MITKTLAGIFFFTMFMLHFRLNSQNHQGFKLMSHSIVHIYSNLITKLIYIFFFIGYIYIKLHLILSYLTFGIIISKILPYLLCLNIRSHIVF